MQKKTHRLVKSPQISARYLADFMSASETAKRTIIRNCKYQPTAPIVQHKQAKAAISGFICGTGVDTVGMVARAAQLRKLMADDEFTRLTIDSNADYLDRFAQVCGDIPIPKAERLAPGKDSPIVLHGVKINVEILFRLRRTTSTNETQTGGGMVRYLKGRALNPETAAWQSAFLLGYLDMVNVEAGEMPDGKLCLTVDAFAGKSYAAPGNALTRFKNMSSAVETIAERWDNVKPPPNAVFE